jgi:hypothetical protein
MCDPQLANDLLGGNPLALGDLLAARCNRGSRRARSSAYSVQRTRLPPAFFIAARS